MGKPMEHMELLWENPWKMNENQNMELLWENQWKILGFLAKPMENPWKNGSIPA